MKIFGIGLSKTGTTSLAHALALLGYKVRDCLGVKQYSKGDLSSIEASILTSNDAFTDTPIPSFYRELDAKYSGSKFILTVRNVDDWLKSCQKQFTSKQADKRSRATNQLFLDLYGTAVFDEDKFRESYSNFVQSVTEYFNDRPRDLLVIDVSSGEGWEVLCPFLKKASPDVPFPKSNVTQIKWLNIHSLAQNVRRSAIRMCKIYQHMKCEDNRKPGNAFLTAIGFSAEKRLSRLSGRSLNVITNELMKVYSKIPIVTKDIGNIPFEVRKSWNHYWLVDCVSSDFPLKDDELGCIVNVAFVEDRTPYLGIVYSPARDILYYAALDKGAYKMIGGDDAIKLCALPRVTAASDTQLLRLERSEAKTPAGQRGTCLPWNLCLLAEDSGSGYVGIERSDEWQTAAGHAVLKAVGRNLLVSSSGKELEYNKMEWANTPVTLCG